MIPVVQSRVGNRGTCFRACLASILELPENAVPDFPRANLDPGVNQFLAKHGLRYTQVPIGHPPPCGWHIVEGVSPRGGQHAVVGHDGHVVHDPHPQDGTGRGLVEPQWWGVLIPARRAEAEEYRREAAKWRGYAKDVSRGMKPVRVLLKQQGRVKLLHLSRPDGGGELYAVEYPHKVGNEDTDKQVMAQFMQLAEAEHLYKRMCEYYVGKAKDRADMQQLRRNTAQQGGPFRVQLTEPDGHEHTESVKKLRTYDSVEGPECVCGENRYTAGCCINCGRQKAYRCVCGENRRTATYNDNNERVWKCVNCNRETPRRSIGRKKAYDELTPIPPYSPGDTIKLANGRRVKVVAVAQAENLLGEPEWHVRTNTGDVVTIKAK